jgi:class 3 adenylate cyclase
VAVQRLGDDAVMAGEPPQEIVVALHVGRVIYGNIGAADRLDFTVIGPAVNLVSRVEAVAKALNLPIVVSDEFARAYDPTPTSKCAAIPLNRPERRLLPNIRATPRNLLNRPNSHRINLGHRYTS